MEDPHEKVQSAILSPYTNNTIKQDLLNESLQILNASLLEASKDNNQVQLVSQMWENYQVNAGLNFNVMEERKKELMKDHQGSNEDDHQGNTEDTLS
ncbi:hypothetical protein WICPIJ_007576 [Wickerhamomyces pijperi]|uniref:DASH complex subunit DAD4 n=1 Tax=Wickerhamomyces pijperi TaxID=599730 RepID=A0A9P8PZK5_WICPI|nr:hypothetical protein WICPIJ_007576 [Wickerhamomyces pijperi]